MKRNEQQSIKGLPIHYLLNDHPCLVVGGGKVAYRKIQLLLTIQARVTVISPEVCPEVDALIKAEKLTHLAQEFAPEKIVNFQLVYAATNNRAVNRNILAACRARGTLCCCVDGNWMKGDFTTPAITRHNKLTLAVSSDGSDCRQSKMVKNSLARHLQQIESANLVVIGTDHRLLSVNEREPYHLTGERLDRVGNMIMQLWGIHEFILLNTCNRIELIALVSNETKENEILPHVLGFSPLSEEHFYRKTELEAFEHLCKVAAGMFSQTPGENHITAQLKEALTTAKEKGWAANMMTDWISSALHLSKRIRNEIFPRMAPCEIEDLALKYLESRQLDLQEATLMVLGAGTVGRAIVERTLPKVRKIHWCYHINCPELPENTAGRIELCTFNDLKVKLFEADVIITAVDAPGYVLHLGHAPFINVEKTVHLIDLGMPRNVEPALTGLLKELSIADLEGLKKWSCNKLNDLNDILASCQMLIRKERHIYDRIADSFKSRNTPE